MLRRYVLPAAAVVLALGLVGGEVGRRDRVKREEAEADWAYIMYRDLVDQEWDAWWRYRRSTVEWEELTSLGDDAARDGNVERAREFDRDAEKARLNAEAGKEYADEVGAKVSEMEDAWRVEWVRFGLEMAERPPRS
jgi:hypothetical protein